MLIAVNDLMTSNSKGHVARGAVLTKLYGEFVKKRPIERSKAVVTWLQVTPGIRSSEIYRLLDTKVDKHDHKEYFYAAQWLAKKVIHNQDCTATPQVMG